MVRLNFYIKNNFGQEHHKTFSDLTELLVECTDELTKQKINVLSPFFQTTLIQRSMSYLYSFFPDTQFEHFFQKVDDEYYFIVNNIHKHPELETLSGKILYDKHLIGTRIQ